MKIQNKIILALSVCLLVASCERIETKSAFDDYNIVWDMQSKNASE